MLRQITFPTWKLYDNWESFTFQEERPVPEPGEGGKLFYFCHNTYKVQSLYWCAFFTSVCVCVWACVWVKNQNIYVFGNSRMLIRLYPPCYFLHLLSLQTKTIIFWVFWKQPNAYSTVSNVHKNCSYSIRYAIFHRKFSQICYKYYYPYFYHDYYITFPFLVLHTQRKTLKNLVCLRQNNNMCILCILIFECKLLPVSHI